MKTEFSKEKLIFAAAALLLAGAAYQHFATKPAALAAGLPVSAQLAPVAFSEKLLADAQLSLAGERKTPFAPPKSEIIVCPTPPPPAGRMGPIGPIELPPGPPIVCFSGTPTDESPSPKPKLNFVGIASTNTQTIGLIRVEKGAPRMVKVGDAVAAEGYTVARIEKQSIQIDGRERIVLKDR